MAENFQIGDTVKLKSGGPIMTITSRGTESGHHCEWFNAEGKVDRANFPAEALKRVETDS